MRGIGHRHADLRGALNAIYRGMRGQVHANAQSAAGLYPVAFLLSDGEVTISGITGPAAETIATVLEAVNDICLDVRPQAALLALALAARNVAIEDQFTEIVENGRVLRPRETTDSFNVVAWVHYWPGGCEIQLEREGRPDGGTELRAMAEDWFRSQPPALPYFA